MCYRTNTEPVSLETDVHCEVKGIGRVQIMQALESHDQNFEFCSKGEGEPLECLWYVWFMFKGRSKGVIQETTTVIQVGGDSCLDLGGGIGASEILDIYRK